MKKQHPASTCLLYEIRVHGLIDPRRAEWFSGMAIVAEGEMTTLSGPVLDQAALRGILSKIWDLNLDVISVRPIKTGARGSWPEMPVRARTPLLVGRPTDCVAERPDHSVTEPESRFAF